MKWKNLESVLSLLAERRNSIDRRGARFRGPSAREREKTRRDDVPQNNNDENIMAKKIASRFSPRGCKPTAKVDSGGCQSIWRARPPLPATRLGYVHDEPPPRRLHAAPAHFLPLTGCQYSNNDALDKIQTEPRISQKASLGQK